MCEGSLRDASRVVINVTCRGNISHVDLDDENGSVCILGKEIASEEQEKSAKSEKRGT